jgi:hypothetical protein
MEHHPIPWWDSISRPITPHAETLSQDYAAARTTNIILENNGLTVNIAASSLYEHYVHIMHKNSYKIYIFTHICV